MKSKIIFFSLIAIICGTNISCSKKFEERLQDKHIIPDVPVYTQIDLSIGGESHDWSNQPQYLGTSSTGKPLGYNGHGIVIYTSDNTEYKCYDATCTNCSDLTSYFEQRDLNGFYAKCPVCRTEFLLIYGIPTDKEKEIYSLKTYPIVKSGNKLIVNYK